MTDQRARDLEMLGELLEGHADELQGDEVEAFAAMRFDLQVFELTDGRGHRQLTDKQRSWVTSVYERIVPRYANLVSRGLVPRGREVPTPPILQNLPKKPPSLPRPLAIGPARSSRKHCGRTDEGCYAFVNGDCTCECCG